ncbi:hypothetical protein COX08_02295 [Candidatus Beckwithbacteria bacterium CG23_combo_of_CG06-09_8_20_14_all_34_8]|uniref:Uncharacterized protein n=1 Tax=Candidatus Beckwithbacteria bacterium CG23_combo_of_CG06-09_8_20_14_all_34_8 TaxID=1974497 RepID=A0A2H0B6F6_9BACT|nr:MAG: hypothetical protein COX08_02295 [Candidatus Beckwithbacteria bacterium CG23_combo_of_CG06-09_8_20_14_all_34_8]
MKERKLLKEQLMDWQSGSFDGVLAIERGVAAAERHKNQKIRRERACSYLALLEPGQYRTGSRDPIKGKVTFSQIIIREMNPDGTVLIVEDKKAYWINPIALCERLSLGGIEINLDSQD